MKTFGTITSIISMVLLAGITVASVTRDDYDTALLSSVAFWFCISAHIAERNHDRLAEAWKSYRKVQRRVDSSILDFTAETIDRNDELIGHICTLCRELKKERPDSKVADGIMERISSDRKDEGEAP